MTSSTKSIIVVGGGIGGTMTVNNLVAKFYPEILKGEIEIMMLSILLNHIYKTANMYVAFNAFYPHELVRKQRSLLRPEIIFHVDGVESFEFEQNRVLCESGKRYHYEYLVISTGCIPAPERIEGLKEAGDHFYQTKSAQQLAQKLRTIQEGRIFITVNFPKTPNVPHQ
jgi:sulfide:quinone oxidoreductase